MIQTTEKENAELLAIYHSDYHDSDQIDDIIGNPVWSEANTQSQGGVYASLVKKGLIICSYGKRNPTVMLTEAARPLLLTLLDETPDVVVIGSDQPMPLFDLTDLP